jgi:hypothetical protein
MCSYVLPLSSPGLFIRVVALTVYDNFSFSANRREIVLFPTPEGPQSTTNTPDFFATSPIITNHHWQLATNNQQLTTNNQQLTTNN